MTSIRQRHVHVFRRPKGADEKCDAGLLLAAGDELAVILTGLHFHRPDFGGEPLECDGCSVRSALRRWRKVTDG